MISEAPTWTRGEAIANLRKTLTCDALAVGHGACHGACRGWGEFSNTNLSRFCSDILGQDIEVVE